MNQDLFVVLLTYVIAMKQHESVCPSTGIIKDQIAKARSLGIKCVFVVDINFDSFSSAKLY